MESEHEEGLRHKGNVDRYIKDLYKKGAQQKKDKEEEAREMKKIEAAAHAAMGYSARPVASTSSEPAAKKQRFSGSMATYSSAASLGLAPEEDEPWFAPGQRRTDQGEAGDWQVVKPSSTQRVAEEPVIEEPQREEAEEEAPTHRSLRERTAVFDDDLYDPGEIKLKRRPGEARVKKEETPAAVAEAPPRATFRPIRFGERVATEESGTTRVKEETEPVKVEVADEKPALAIAKEEEKPQVEAGLFKKRKRKV